MPLSLRRAREEEPATGRHQIANTSRRTPRRHIGHKHRTGLCAIGFPKLAAMEAVVGGEVKGAAQKRVFGGHAPVGIPIDSRLRVDVLHQHGAG